MVSSRKAGRICGVASVDNLSLLLTRCRCLPRLYHRIEAFFELPVCRSILFDVMPNFFVSMVLIAQKENGMHV